MASFSVSAIFARAPTSRRIASRRAIGFVASRDRFVHQVLNQDTVEIIATKTGITRGREHTEDRLAVEFVQIRRNHLEHRDVKGPTPRS